MTTAESGTDDTWGKLATADPDERGAALEARYRELASASEQERRARLIIMARTEYSLPDDQMRTMTLSRMRAMLRMDPVDAKAVITSLNAVMDQLPGSFAMRRVALVQTLSREFDIEDQQRLRDLVPGIFGDIALRIPEAPVAPPRTASTSKAWWAFWKKG